MEKKLKRRFCFMALAALLIVVLIVSTQFHYIAYNRIFAESNALMDYIAANDGEMPDYREWETSGEARRDLHITPETRYSTRYFSVTLDKTGAVRDVYSDSIASYSRESLVKLAQDLQKDDQSAGFFDEKTSGNAYRYRFYDADGGGRLLVCIDVTFQYRAMLQMLLYSSLVLAAVVVLFAVVVRLLAGRAVAPMVKNAAQQKEFITNAGHELKTPLAVISANTEMQEILTGKNEWTESTMRQVNRLNGLVKELVILARLDENTAVGKETADLTAMTRDAADALRSVAAQQGKTLTVSIEEDVSVKGDVRSLRELPVVLTDNAVKYCEDGGSIHVSLTGGKHPKLEVTNDYANPDGVDPNRFFERFYRGDPSHNSRIEGYGIGLSLAKSVTEKHGGKMTARCHDGKITFTAVF